MTFAGIYAIRHTTDGKVYVGQARNIARRIRQHTSKRSQCTHIKNAIQAYGWGEFEVLVLEAVDDFSILDAREQHWIDTLNAANPNFGYNICPTVGSRVDVPHSHEACAKMSEAKRGKPLSAEHKASIAKGKSRSKANRDARIASELMSRSISKNHLPITKKLFTIPEAADKFTVSTRTIKRWYEQGLISLVRLPGGHFRVPASEITRLTNPETTEAE